MDEFIKDNVLHSLLKLVDTKNTSYSNMHLYNKNGTIQKYETVESILREYYDIRLKYYKLRKRYLLKKYDDELLVINAKIRFIIFQSYVIIFS